MEPSRQVREAFKAVRSYVDYYDVFGYYKPALALLSSLLLIDLSYRDGIAYILFARLRDAVQHLSQVLVLAFGPSAATTAGQGVDACLAEPAIWYTGFVVVLVVLASLFASVYIVGHIVAALSQLIEVVFVQALADHPIRRYLEVYRDRTQWGSFRKWFFRNPRRAALLQLLPIWFVLLGLFISLTQHAIRIPDAWWNSVMVFLFLLFVVAPKFHVSIAVERRLQYWSFGIAMMLYLLLVVLTFAMGVEDRIVYFLFPLASAALALPVLDWFGRFARAAARGRPSRPDAAWLVVLLGVVSNHLFFLYNALGLKKGIEDYTFGQLIKNSERTWGTTDATVDAVGLWWHSYISVMNEAPEAHKAIYHWLSMQGFARSLSATFLLGSLYYVYHPLIFSSGKGSFCLWAYGLLLACSYLFFYRFLYLHVKYYTNFTLRTAAQLAAAASHAAAM